VKRLLDKAHEGRPAPAGPLWLASTSPRRSALLDQLGVAFRACPVEADERVRAGERPEDYVQRVARAKLRDGARRLQARGERSGVVLAADTAVVVDDEILGKPAHREAALGMLTRLSGRAHRVLSCVCIGGLAADAPAARAVTSDTSVWFRVLDRAECERYWASGEPEGKAGAYAIQGLGAAFVTRIDGSYSGVVGLPLCETATLLESTGVWQLG
jgi:septum formation protein